MPEGRVHKGYKVLRQAQDDKLSWDALNFSLASFPFQGKGAGRRIGAWYGGCEDPSTPLRMTG
ncbi:hypothetical protein OC25_26420 [Pedobacter kyungheensis]|uniref:Uncharacterized protein n=1 Tax=Pedobacter kyungheensis TaxID=1069985 RepID=A0A0C1CV50_9SPHI|nr:hypothetical protein OC25_26420 [Pedobacter kyungheensis]